MKIGGKLPAILVLGVVAAGVITVAWKILAPSAGDADGKEIALPVLSPVAAAGKIAFDTACAECHGQNAAGTDKGPPFVHDIYNPGHHGDAAFFRAVRQGVPQHHWPYGNMPPQPGLSDQEIAAIVVYVRELQAANNIAARPHRMP